jgi:hypothetical protein
MSIQSALNQQAIDMLPLVSEAIKNGNSFDSNQMYCKAIYLICNSKMPLSEMNEKQISEFDNDLIKLFKINGWINK